MAGAHIHADITLDTVMEAAERMESQGFCIRCGHETDGVEPDAREYECENCGENGVYGAEQLIVESLFNR